MTPTQASPQFEVLRVVLARLFGDLDEATFEIIRPYLAWTELAGGEVLFREGDPSDALYVLISGRLQALVADAKGLPQVVGEIGRGESVGEMGVFSGMPRRATVAALRDSVLARIDLAGFETVLKTVPTLTLNLSRLIIERLQRSNTSQKKARNVTNIAVVRASEGVPVGAFLRELTEELQRQQQTVTHLTSEIVDAAAGRPGAAQGTDDPQAHFWLANYLDELETRCSLVFYETDATPTAWTLRCLRQADEVLLVADVTAPPEQTTLETACLGVSTTRARQELVLLHPTAEAEWAEGTLPFLRARPNVQRHYHVRAGNRKDLGRLARFLSGNAIGLVLAGGGARGLAHIGVFRALEEAGVPVDFIGGTSIGSVLGSCLARDWGWQRIRDENRVAFLSNPTSDFNFLPLVSLLAGRKLRRILKRSMEQRHIEEMWVPFYCVSSNFTRACEHVHLRGELKRALLASMAIPGVFPPSVEENDLLVDGGVFNNMPVDIMARTGVRTILAVDLRPDNKQRRELGFDEVPGAWALWFDRLFRAKAKRRYPVPSMLTILITTNTLASEQKEALVIGDVDVHINPDVRRFGLLEWKAFDLLVEEGYRHAQEVLARQTLPF